MARSAAIYGGRHDEIGNKLWRMTWRDPWLTQLQIKIFTPIQVWSEWEVEKGDQREETEVGRESRDMKIEAEGRERV